MTFSRSARQLRPLLCATPRIPTSIFLSAFQLVGLRAGSDGLYFTLPLAVATVLSRAVAWRYLADTDLTFSDPWLVL